MWINDKVLVPADSPETAKLIETAGYQVIKVEMSEFQKIDSALTCLSLRY